MFIQHKNTFPTFSPASFIMTTTKKAKRVCRGIRCFSFRSFLIYQYGNVLSECNSPEERMVHLLPEMGRCELQSSCGILCRRTNTKPIEKPAFEVLRSKLIWDPCIYVHLNGCLDVQVGKLKQFVLLVRLIHVYCKKISHTNVYILYIG